MLCSHKNFSLDAELLYLKQNVKRHFYHSISLMFLIDNVSFLMH